MKLPRFINKRTIFVAIIVILLLLSIYFVFIKKKDNGIDELIKDSMRNDKFPLKLGSKGERVTQLQGYLLSNGGALPKHGVDGIFGEETLSQVQKVLGTDEITQFMFTDKKIGEF